MAPQPTVVVGFTGVPVASGDVDVTTERIVRLTLPGELTRAHVALGQRDLEAILDALRTYPDDVVELQNAALRLDFTSATKIAKRIGLTEEQLVERGGAKIALAGGILIGLVILAIVIGSDSGSGEHTIVGPEGGVPPQGPSGGDAGPSNAGAPDAGNGG